MSAGVLSCDTCMPSYVRCDGSSNKDGGGNLAHKSTLGYRADEDATVEDWAVSVSWDAKPDIYLETAVAKSSTTQSVPSKILEIKWMASIEDEKLVLHV